MRRVVLSIATFCTLIGAAQASRSVTLEWDASPDSDISGYRVQYGVAPGSYTQTVEVPNSTTTPVAGLAEDKPYFFVVKAVNTAGLVSEPSNEVFVPAIIVEPPPVVVEPPPVVVEPPPVVAPEPNPQVPQLSTYDTWSTQVKDATQRSSTSDPDGDGLTNLAEYALGRQPESAEAKPLLDLTVKGNVMGISFDRPADRTDVSYVLQESGDMVSWRSVTDSTQSVEGTAVRNSIQRDLTGTYRVFYRLLIASGTDSTVTTPYGALGTLITGTGSTAGTVASSMFGLGLTRPPEYTGNAESVGQDLLYDEGANWQDGQFEGGNGVYVLEITSGAAAGTTYDIVQTSAAGRTVRVAQPFAANVLSGSTYQIRKHWTLASVFGSENQSGLSPEDRVFVWNGNTYEQYYYDGTPINGGWRNVAAPTVDAGNTIFYPEDGITVQRRTNGDSWLYIAGAVKRTVTSLPIPAGTTMVANVYAGPMTLDSSGLYTGNPATGVKNGTPGTADQVLLWNGSRYLFFYYKRTAGWREINGSNNGNAGGTVIPPGASITILRSGTEGFNWVPPVHPAGL